MPAIPQPLFNATIIHRHDIGPRLSIVRIRPDVGEAPVFLPGQYCVVGMRSGPAAGVDAALVRRAYSIASAAGTRGHVELYVSLAGDGATAPQGWHGAAGDRIYLDPVARGSCTLEGLPARADLVMVATGTGIAPFVSMLRTYQKQGRWRRLAVIHGVRRAADLGYRGDLEEIAALDPTVTYLPTVTREPDGSVWAGLRGRVTTLIDGGVCEARLGWRWMAPTTHVFLCGNPAMVAEVQGMLEHRGFMVHLRHRPGSIHTEDHG